MSQVPAPEWPRQRLRTRLASWLLNPHGAPSRARLQAAVEGKTVLVTGASFGVGEATARLLGSAGARVLLVARSRDQLELVAAAVRAAGGTAEVHPADLTDTAGVADLGRRLAAHGPIDVVISNAGKSIRRSVALSLRPVPRLRAGRPGLTATWARSGCCSPSCRACGGGGPGT